MSKIVISLLISFSVLLNLSTTEAFATSSCQAEGITCTPIFFPENSGDLKIKCSVDNANTLNYLLQGKDKRKLRLHFGEGPLSYNTDPNTITKSDPEFELTIKEDREQAKKGPHQGVLDWYDDSKSDFDKFCDGIQYQVGAPPKQCKIDPRLDERIPPKSTITIKFIGQANSDYKLTSKLHLFDFLFLGATQDSKLGETKTESNGQGKFSDISIPGQTGDIVTLEVRETGLIPSGEHCSKDIQISISAPPPSTPSDKPVVPEIQIIPKVFVGPPAVSKGIACDPKGLAIQTAIGCIHTSPVGFIKDFLKFILGISGGLAFLMMLLGVFQMLTSAGNPETLQAGRERLTSAIIGLLFVIFAVLLLQIIGVSILNIPGFK